MNGTKRRDEREYSKPKVNIIELGNLKVVSETEGLNKVAEVFSALVKKNKKIIKPREDMRIPPEMFG